MRLEIVRGHARIARHDAGLDHFTVIRVGDADHRHHTYAGVGVEHALDLRRIHVESIDDDHVFLTLDDIAVSVFVHGRDIAGVKPDSTVIVSPQHGGAFFRAVPVALHHLRATD